MIRTFHLEKNIQNSSLNAHVTVTRTSNDNLLMVSNTLSSWFDNSIAFFSFSMFTSAAPYWDLIFNDATQKLVVVDEGEQEYREYLGSSFLRAMETVDCTAGSPVNIPQLRFIMTSLITALIIRRWLLT